MGDSQPRAPHLLNLAQYREAPAAGDSKSPVESTQVGWMPTTRWSPLQWTLSRLSQGIHSLAAHGADCHRVMRDSAARRPSHAWVLTTVVLALAATWHTTIGTAAALDSPSTVVQHTSDRVIAVLSDKSLSSQEQRHKVEAIVYEYFDFVTLSKLVLARNWKQLTPEQQTAFIEEFKQHLSITYGRNLDRYNNEKVVVTGERAETGGDYTVKSKILRPGAEDVLVDYRLRQQDGAWKVIDVIIEGVSLVANFRSQFQEVITGGGPDKLIRLLHEKNEKGEPIKS